MLQKWLGRVTDDTPPTWVHMLGTDWAEKKRPKFMGENLMVRIEAMEKKIAVKAAKEAAKEAEKAAKAAAKAAEKAAKAAAKEASKEASKKAAAKKAADKAAKEAETAKKAVELIETMLRAFGASLTSEKRAQFSVMLKAVSTDLGPKLVLIGFEHYEVSNGNVYEWTADSGRGDYLGRLTGTSETGYDVVEELEEVIA
jgi:hypothetical protein